MSRVHVDDREMGRGRQNDSSSSRESSPRQTKKRSFSPTSDDGDMVVPPIAYDDTPPPPDRPLLRQPVAFAWTSSTSVDTTPAAFNTYQIAIPSATEVDFLPGQKPVVPGPPPSRRRKKNTDGPSKKKKKTDYAGQTTRFRLQPSDPFATMEPPIPQVTQIQPFDTSPSVEPAVSQDHSPTFREVSGTPTASATSPSPNLVYPHSRDIAFQPPFPEPVAAPSKESQPAQKKSKQSSKTTVPVMKWKVAYPPAKSRKVAYPQASSSTSPLTTRPPPNEYPPVSYTHESSYYRRDYESDFTLYEPESAPPSTSYRPQAEQHQALCSTSSMRDASAARNLMHHLPVPDPGFRDASRPSVSKSLAQTAGSSSTHRIHDAGTAETRRPQKPPFLMLTLLIQDIRSGVTDHQLAEVRLPMKPANDPSDGFWADARLLGQQLQSSASRIDGPAKVYTLRGKYRQFFLRVTAENADEFVSTHLAIKPDRMLDVVVEELLPPGQLPLPPQIPRNLIKSPTPDSSSSSPTPERETFQELPFERQRNQDRIMRDFEELRRLQQSSERAGSSSSRGSAQSGTGGRKPKKANPQKRKRSTDRRPKSSEPMPIAPKPAVTVHSGDNMPRFDSPDPDDSPEEVHRLVTSAVDQIVQDDVGWMEFFQAKAALQPHRAMDVLKQYRFVKRMIDKLAGQQAPFQSVHINIEPSHITQALKIDEPNFASACVETLALLELYGPKGHHYEDSRVVEMVHDASRPEYNAKPIKRLLHLMRDIDNKWKEEHPPKGSVSAPAGDFRTMRG